MSKKKRVIVLFSGGLDSTYLVWKNLKEGNIVYPVHITINGNQNKTIIEKNAIDKIHSMLLADDLPGELRSLKHVYEFNGFALQNNSMWAQLPVWMLGILFSPLQEADEVQIGYVMGDDILTYSKEIKAIFNSYRPFLLNDAKNIKFTFPLHQTGKSDMVEALPEKYLKRVVFCEDPRNIREVDDDVFHKNCGTCGSCKTYKYREIFYKFRGIDLGGDDSLLDPIDPQQLSLGLYEVESVLAKEERIEEERIEDGGYEYEAG